MPTTEDADGRWVTADGPWLNADEPTLNSPGVPQDGRMAGQSDNDK